jgi:excisionase family DNA binding protein
MSRLLTFAQVAERLGNTPLKTVQNWASAGRFPVYKPGRHPMVREADLEAFIEGARVGGVRKVGRK